MLGNSIANRSSSAASRHLLPRPLSIAASIQAPQQLNSAAGTQVRSLSQTCKAASATPSGVSCRPQDISATLYLLQGRARAPTIHTSKLIASSYILTSARRHKSTLPSSANTSIHEEQHRPATAQKGPVKDEHQQKTSPGREQSHPFSARPQPFAAAQPPPRQHSAPRLIRYPPPDAEAIVPPPPAAQPAALYTYTRGPASRLFSYRNVAAAASSSRRASPFGRSPYSYYWPTTSSSTSISSSFEPIPSAQIDELPSSGDSRQERLPSSVEATRTMSATTTGVGASNDGLGPRRRVNGQVAGQDISPPASSSKSAAKSSEHEHSHGWFDGHSHGHTHGAEGSAEDADKLLAALKGKGDRGSNITVVGLIANLVLCGAKGIAGVLLHSASLLADAAHSLSDTFSDLVTLFCWKMSQKPASVSHPLGYGKFETMGGLGVSVVLVAGAFAIGMHSYGLLLEVLQPHLQQMPAGLQAISSLTGDIARAAGGMLHDHTHTSAAPVATGDAASTVLNGASGSKAAVSAHEDGHGLLDPNAMWFALISILVKEWLYRATLKIAREENSSVLEANAIHHRSDSLSSGVTFLAIAGSYLGFPVLDPLGGLLVAGLIGKQGAELLVGALNDLSDRGVQPEVLDDFENVLRGIMDDRNTKEASGKTRGARLLGWKDLRAVRSGVSSFVDVTLLLDADTPLKNAQSVESRVREDIAAAHKGVKEVRVRLEPHHQSRE